MSTDIAVKDKNQISFQLQDGDDQFLALIERVILNPEVDPSKLNALLDVKERMLNKEAEQAFNRDFLQAKLEMPRIVKKGSVDYLEDKTNKTGPKVNAFKYAKYEHIDESIRPIEEKYGFTRLFTTSPRAGEGGGTTVHCKLLHKSGHFIESQIGVALDVSGGKNNIQAMGSSFSYGKRYTTEMIWDIVKEGADDDANSVDLIDDKQFKKLKALLDETNTVEKDFTGYYGAEALDQLPKRVYEIAHNILLTKKNMQLSDKLKAQNAGP